MRKRLVCFIKEDANHTLQFTLPIVAALHICVDTFASYIRNYNLHIALTCNKTTTYRYAKVATMSKVTYTFAYRSFTYPGACMVC